MKKNAKKIAFIVILFIAGNSFAQSYNFYKSIEDESKDFNNINEKVLFILDFSKSMAEKVGDKKKVDLMRQTMSEILPRINKKIMVGLRVYGNKYGFSAYDACRTSSLLVPISGQNSFEIEQKLAQTTPKGMTPITYSLNQAVLSDFKGFGGKKHIVLLTDGGEDCDESPCTWAVSLMKQRKDVKVDVVAFNINNKDDLDQLRCTASVTNGNFYQARTAIELAKDLNNSLDIKKQIEAKIIPNP